MSSPHDALSELLTTDQVAAILGLKRNTLEIYRLRGGNLSPPFIKLSPSKRAPVRYRRSDVEAWIAQRTFDSTSAYSGKGN